MKYLQVKNFKIKNKIVGAELSRKFYKSIFLNVSLPTNMRHFALAKLLTKKKQESITSFRGRCVFTGNSRSVLKFFKQSRMQFRYFASGGLLSGIRKASW